MKALIISVGRRPPYVQELGKLLAHCPAELQANAALCDAAKPLDDIYPRTRYPVGEPISRAEGEAVVAAAKLIRDAARPLVRGA